MKLHQQAEHYILDRIQNGELKPGDRIPTEAELAGMLHASRPTIRQALNKLAMQGYLIRKKGIGSFVTEKKLIHESTSYLSSYHKEAEKNHFQILTEVLRQEIIDSDELTAEKLGLRKGKPVTVLTRLRRIPEYNHGHPVVLTTVFIPFHMFPEMAEVDFKTDSLYGILESRNIGVKQAHRELEVMHPDEKTARLLEISHFEPVIFITSSGRTADGAAVEYAQSYYPAGCSKFMMDLHHL